MKKSRVLLFSCVRQNIKLNSLHPVKIFMIGTKIKENEYFVRQVSQTVINAQKEKVGEECPFKRDRTKCRSWILNTNGEKLKGKRMVLLGGRLIFCLFLQMVFEIVQKRMHFLFKFCVIIKIHKIQLFSSPFNFAEKCWPKFFPSVEATEEKSRWDNYRVVQTQRSWNIWETQNPWFWCVHFETFMFQTFCRVARWVHCRFNENRIEFQSTSGHDLFCHLIEVRVWRSNLLSKCSQCWVFKISLISLPAKLLANRIKRAKNKISHYNFAIAHVLQ